MRITIIEKKRFPEARKLYKKFEVVKKGEICIAIGGDGTFIRAARSFDGPILPVRRPDNGSIGYYADISTKELDRAIEKLLEREYAVERLANKIEIVHKGKHYYAVNEAVMNNMLEEVSFKVYEIVREERQEIYPYVMSGDGVLITSVVGSTAYNKSAGGPIILSPDVFCITFINVDGPYRNPIVVGSGREIEIEIVKYNGELRYDGMSIGKLRPGDSFRVRLSEKQLKVVRFRDPRLRENFGAKLERIIKSRMKK